MNQQAHLVSIHSDEEHNFVVGLYAGGFPWLGGQRDPANPVNFVWSDGTPWDYSNWVEGQPEGQGVEECVQDWDNGNGWNHTTCSRV